MTERVQVLDILLDITRKGMRFYEQAATQCADRALAATFTRIARAKLTLLENFGAPQTDGTGAFSTPGSLSDSFRSFYESAKAQAIAGDPEMLTLLAEREQRLLDALQKEALAQGKPLSIRAAASLVLPPLAAAIEALKPIAVEQPETIQPQRRANAA